MRPKREKSISQSAPGYVDISKSLLLEKTPARLDGEVSVQSELRVVLAVHVFVEEVAEATMLDLRLVGERPLQLELLPRPEPAEVHRADFAQCLGYR